MICFIMTGVGGLEGDGDIFRPDNQQAFIKFVKDNTDGQGVHMVMADGVCTNILCCIIFKKELRK